MSIHSKGTTKGLHDAIVHVGTPATASAQKDWARTNVYFHGFKDMPEVRGKSVKSPPFNCMGYEWEVTLYPRGSASSSEETEMISVFLKLISSSSVKVEWGLANKKLEAKKGFITEKGSVDTFEQGSRSWGYDNFQYRTKALASIWNEALVIEVKMRPATNPPPFIPNNPSECKIIHDLFNEEEDADVVFVVGSTKFYAHKLILKKAAPQLAELCMSDESQSPIHIEIPGISSSTVNKLLLYIYGRPIPGFGMEPSLTKEIVEAADKYGVTNLKLEAEAYYVASLKITVENVLEQLLFADSVNCALLKEKVMDFILENSFEVLSTNVLRGAPSDLFRDTLAAMARKGGTDKAGPMFISELRRKCYEEGLEIDGSREMLTSALAGEDGNEAGVVAGQDGTADQEDDNDGDEDNEEEDDEEENDE